MNTSVQRLKEGLTYRGTGDNWNMKVKKSHMRKEVQNDELNRFASNLIENRVSFKDLPNDEPKGDISQFKVKQTVLSKDEWSAYIFYISSSAYISS